MATIANSGNAVSINDLQIDRQFRETSLDPGDRMRLRLLTVRHRDRLKIEPATPEAILVIVDEYRCARQEAAAR